eukprot:GILK01005467.1.p1 GENE.GILK01005467.1~~GILK01005467.1.p1  ORF type:complete len:358 (-),score=48.90 GILK01005467.1:86-1090(-)
MAPELSLMERMQQRSPLLTSPNLISQLPENVVEVLIPMLLGDSLGNSLCVCVHWHLHLSAIFKSFYERMVDRPFQAVYGKYLHLEDARMIISKLLLSKSRGVRIDRVLLARVLPAAQGHNVKIAANFQVHKGRSFSSCAEYKFDVFSKRSRRHIWIHKDECQFNRDEHERAYSQHSVPLCVGDSVEIAVNLSSLNGFIDASSITWRPPVLTEAVYERICDEIEDIQIDWSLQQYFIRPQDCVIPGPFEPQLKHKYTEFSGSDITVSRSLFTARQEGLTPNSLDALGCYVTVYAKDTPLHVPVKRLGLLHDRELEISLRIGDELLIYISRGGEEC